MANPEEFFCGDPEDAVQPISHSSHSPDAEVKGTTARVKGSASLIMEDERWGVTHD